MIASVSSFETCLILHNWDAYVSLLVHKVTGHCKTVRASHTVLLIEEAACWGRLSGGLHFLLREEVAMAL